MSAKHYHPAFEHAAAQLMTAARASVAVIFTVDNEGRLIASTIASPTASRTAYRVATDAAHAIAKTMQDKAT